MNKVLLDVRQLCSTNSQRRAYNELVKELGEKELCFQIIKGVRSQSSKLKTTFFNDLQEYQGLKKNWDGYNALPINKKVILNTFSIIESLPSKILKEWVMFPSNNGTILFTIKRKTKHSSFNIGVKDYSYFATIDGEDQEGIEKFNINSFVENIIRITNRLINGQR